MDDPTRPTFGCKGGFAGYDAAPWPRHVMLPSSHIRLVDLIARIPADAARSLADDLGVEPEGIPGLCAHPSWIQRRADDLGEDARAILDGVLQAPSGWLDALDGQGLDRDLIGLVYTVEVEGRIWWVTPIETRLALLDPTLAEVSDVAVLLATREDDELERLATLHGVEPREDDDAVDVAIAISDALLDTERLHDLLESLPSTARALLFWMTSEGRSATESELAAHASHLAERNGETSTTAERVLQRLGLLVPLPTDDTRVVVPRDLSFALGEVLDGFLADVVFERYEQLRTDGLPAFRDVFPRGAGGDPLIAFRTRLLLALHHGHDPAHAVDRLLVGLRIARAEGTGAGELASYHLDVSGPESVARRAMRAWMSSIDDGWTRTLVDAFGGDNARLTEPLFAPESEDAAGDRDQWMLFLYHLRGQLLFLLGALSPGHWYSLDALGTWFCAVYRRTAWDLLGRSRFRSDIPRDALPVPSIAVTAALNGTVTDALRTLVVEFFEPLGSMRLDPSGQRFMTNPEALRVFRDDDAGFGDLWALCEDWLGDDVDLWMPLPSDPGARVHGVSRLVWLEDGRLVADPDAHLDDLLRIAEWTHVQHDGTGLVFTFDADSVARGEDRFGADPDEFLLWLHVRSGGVPGRVRAHFPLSGATIDGGDAAIADAARVAVQSAVESVERWGAQPPLPLLEEVRSWGAVAVPPLLSIVEDAAAKRDFDAPMIVHACVLLGELGMDVALPALLRTVAWADDEGPAAAAAMAVARIGGSDAVEGLVALLNNESATWEQRLHASRTLSSLAALHPRWCDLVHSHLSTVYDAHDLPSDVATLIAVDIAETGHPDTEPLLFRVRERGLWDETVHPFDEAIWTASLSPAIWGHPWFGAAMAMLYPHPDDAPGGARVGNVDLADLGRAAGVEVDRVQDVLAARGRRRRRRDTDDEDTH